jgi:hypothetical protein
MATSVKLEDPAGCNRQGLQSLAGLVSYFFCLDFFPFFTLPGDP